MDFHLFHVKREMENIFQDKKSKIKKYLTRLKEIIHYEEIHS